MQMFPRVYRSFGEFERRELSKLDQLYRSVDRMVDEMLLAELDEDDLPGARLGDLLFTDIEDA